MLDRRLVRAINRHKRYWKIKHYIARWGLKLSAADIKEMAVRLMCYGGYYETDEIFEDFPEQGSECADAIFNDKPLLRQMTRYYVQRGECWLSTESLAANAGVILTNKDLEQLLRGAIERGLNPQLHRTARDIVCRRLYKWEKRQLKLAIKRSNRNTFRSRRARNAWRSKSRPPLQVDGLVL